jgi:hypothetical protein
MHTSSPGFGISCVARLNSWARTLTIDILKLFMNVQVASLPLLANSKTTLLIISFIELR